MIDEKLVFSKQLSYSMRLLFVFTNILVFTGNQSQITEDEK